MVQISSPPPRTSTQIVSGRRARVAAMALIRLGLHRMRRASGISSGKCTGLRTAVARSVPSWNSGAARRTTVRSEMPRARPTVRQEARGAASIAAAIRLSVSLS